MRSSLGVIGFAAAMALCCAAPVLIAAGGLGLIGALLADPYLIGGALLALAATIWLIWARRRTGGDADCCPPRPTPPREDLREE
ncbi:hypothetical protein CDO52_26445 [Nocardiopsis gilva YIM 90087]|uniref:Mercury transporter n=1 Tax=Nocardiopsis gilva YIM 90087 TaxID=1235441 RepID=A0A223SCN9_9ACTN|nr:hypothetical protein [Nocardiopsis gilva]ASU85870.1 hypothetical protein CDO52_26445 [Nocardiopsis gilva YIM 90087]